MLLTKKFNFWKIGFVIGQLTVKLTKLTLKFFMLITEPSKVPFLVLFCLHCLSHFWRILRHQQLMKMTTNFLAVEKQKKVENSLKETKLAMKWFLKSGLCVNKKKTEVCVFNRNDSRIKDVVLGNEKVSVLKSIKLLGLIFDSKLNWYTQAMCAIEKPDKDKVQQILSRYFSTDEFLKLAMALFYSRFYYVAKVWLSSAL